MISNTRAAVSAYAEAITDGIQDRLRLRLFESIWAQGRNVSSAYDVRRVVIGLLWLYRLDPSAPGPPPTCRLRSCMTPTRCGSYAGKAASITPDGGPLTTAAYHRARQWRQQWLALFEPALLEPEPIPAVMARPCDETPAVIGPDGAVHVGPNGLRCLAAIVGPDALSWRTAPALATARHLPVG